MRSLRDAFEDLFREEEPRLNPKEAKKLWERFVGLSDTLKGSRLEFSNHGGDQLRLNATLESIRWGQNGLVVLAVKDATWVAEGDNRTEDELTPKPFPYSEVVMDPSWGIPEFHEEEGKIRQVNLPGLCELDSFSIGFIWPQA
ncbi:MAG: hypothetical protein Q8P35_00450 [Candidatus Yanofskybacteria bacterium]|nr:hypothetical protein [Candidatus Yanofskybacteria bacterium]